MHRGGHDGGEPVMALNKHTTHFSTALGKELDYSLELWYNAFSIRVFPIAG